MSLNGWRCTGGAERVALHGWRCTGGTARVALHGWRSTDGVTWVARVELSMNCTLGVARVIFI